MLGAGGGRIFPGTGGTAGSWDGTTIQWTGGAGGSANNPGESPAWRGGGGGGWGASGGAGNNGAGSTTAGGAGGKAVETNGNGVIWVNNDTTRVYGAVSGSASSFTISSNQQELNLYNYVTSLGYNKNLNVGPVTVTINSGVYIWSDNTSIAALTTGEQYSNKLTIINNGYIIGKGGEGGCQRASGDTINAAGKPGGPALSLVCNATIINNSYIAGGGGGGSSMGAGAGGGGGAGGGKGGGCWLGTTYYDYGGAGGAPGNAGVTPTGTTSYAGVWGAVPGRRGSGGGGGRILPGTGGTTQLNISLNLWSGTGGGAGGAGGSWASQPTGQSDLGGVGGAAGNAGGVGSSYNSSPGGGGGGWGASGGSGYGAGGAGGNAIQLNGFTAIRSGSGTTYGAVS